MDIDVAKTLSHQMMPLYELKDLFMCCLSGHGEKSQEGKNFVPVLEIATSKLTDNERMAHHFPITQ